MAGSTILPGSNYRPGTSGGGGGAPAGVGGVRRPTGPVYTGTPTSGPPGTYYDAWGNIQYLTSGQSSNDAAKRAAGYVWDPVKGEYVHSPTQQGQAVNEYNKAANPQAQDLFGRLSGLLSGGVGGQGGAGGGGGGTGGTGNILVNGGNDYGPGGGGGGGTGGISGGSNIAPVAMPDFTASNNAAFATAKDKAGKISRASLDSLRGELGATGNLGGGAEVQAVRDTVNENAGLLGQVSRDQAEKQAETAADFAKTGYAGNITQRGQDVSAAQANAQLAQTRELANARLAFEQRQADSARQLQLLTLALSGLKGAGGGGAGGGGLVY